MSGRVSGALLRPSIPDLVAIIPILGVPLRGALDPQDTAAHLRIGEMILRSGGIPQDERLSYTLEGEPLVLSGWLSDVLFAATVRLGGLAAAVLLVTGVLAATYALLAVLLRRRGVDPRIAMPVMLLSLFLGTAGWSVRPHVFSYAGAAALLYLLERGATTPAWQYALLFLVWANLHGGFAYGLVLAAVYLAGALVEAQWGDAAVWRPRVRAYLAGLAAGGAATLATPYGPGFYAQIRDTLSDPRLLAQVQEYGPPDLQAPEGLMMYAALAAVILTFALVRRRPPAPTLLATLAFLYPALLAQRHVPLFGIVVPPLLGLAAGGQVWRRGEGYRFGDHLAEAERRTRIGPAAGIALLLVGGLVYLGGREAGALARFDPREVPVEAIARARGAGLAGRVFHDPNWGGYLLYAWPEKQAYIHPLRYDLELVESAVATDRAEPGWREELERWEIAVALLAPDSPLAAALEAEPGWVVWERTPTAVLLRRVAPMQEAGSPGRQPDGSGLGGAAAGPERRSGA